MNLIVTYTFKHKERLKIEYQNFTISDMMDRETLAEKVKRKLIKDEIIQLKNITCELNGFKNEREMNRIPNWFFTTKGKLNFKNGKLQ